MLKQVIDYLQKCPFFENTIIGQDFLGEEDGSVSVQMVACNPVVQQYADGATLRQFTFAVLVRLYNGTDAEHYFERVSEWFLQGVPQLKDGRCAQRFEIVKSSAVQDREYGSVCYEMTWRLLYYQRECER